tara:strand:- start:422 stop:1060 length:639 start_codon:yes stop_codon:yes gene_type:complete
MKNKTTLIGIAGGTGSGKSCLAKALINNKNQSNIALIFQDSYYNDISELTLNERKKNNFDHPKSLDFKLLKNHLNAILMGKSIDIPIYDFSSHLRLKQVTKIKKHSIIILEGIFALYDKDIRNMMDIKIYVDTPDDIRIIRRIKRDINKRKRTFNSVVTQYHETVRPMHIKYVEPTKKYADIIIPGGGKNDIANDILNSKIASIIEKSREQN